jgi:hypothetical protein
MGMTEQNRQVSKLQALAASSTADRERGPAILDHLAHLCPESGYTLHLDLEVDGIATVGLAVDVIRLELTKDLGREEVPADG